MSNQEVKIEVIQPFSNIIYRVAMPEVITQRLITHTDKLRENSDTPSFGHSLVGQVEEELEIDISKLDPTTGNFLLNCSREWLYNQLKQGFGWESSWNLPREEIFPQFISMWTVSQRDGEYNPIHTHPAAAVSGVLYLKIPEYKKDKKDTTKPHKQRTDDGSLVFTNNSGADRRYCVSNCNVNPKVGELYIFGGMQPHQVYPFRSVDGQGERRSVSFNVAYRTKEQLEANHMIGQGVTLDDN
jgi:hypothetical protein